MPQTPTEQSLDQDRKAKGKQVVSALKDTQLRTAKSKDADYRLSDGDGLFLLIGKDGGKWWRFSYTSPIDGKRKLISFGTYPETSLEQARAKRREAKQKISDGIDPSKERQAITKANEAESNGLLHNVLQEWLRTLTAQGDTVSKIKSSFERDFLPYFSTKDKDGAITSSRHISTIKLHEALKPIHEKENEAQETARRLFSNGKRLWGFAVLKGYTDNNIFAAIERRDALKKYEVTHYAKVTDEKILAELLRDIDNCGGHIITRTALKLQTYVMLRPNNLASLKWAWVDFEKKQIKIPRSQMKSKNKNLPDFIMPLAPQPLKLLQDLHQLTGWGEWVFHGIDNSKQPINYETLNKILRERLRYNDETAGRKQRLHSFRGTFRSLCDTHHDKHNQPFEVREACLDHHETDTTVRAYSHASDYTEQMRVLLQWWADYLDGVKNG